MIGISVIKPFLKDLLSKYSPEDIENSFSTISQKLKDYEKTNEGKARIVLEQHEKKMVVTLQVACEGRLKTDENFNKKPLSYLLDDFKGENELPMGFAMLLPAIPEFLNLTFSGFAKDQKPKKIMFFLEDDKITVQINSFRTDITIENGRKYANHVLVESTKTSPMTFLNSFLEDNTDETTVTDTVTTDSK